MTTPKKIEFKGEMKTVREISEWVSKNKPYTLTPAAIRLRYHDGHRDDELVGPHKPKDPRNRSIWKQNLVPVSVPGWGYRPQTGER